MTHCCPSLPAGAVTDMAMISNMEMSSSLFYLSCVTGDRHAADLNLDITNDYRIFILPSKPNFKTKKPVPTRVEAKGFEGLDYIGIFYCEASSLDATPIDKITLINNYQGRQTHNSLNLKAAPSCYEPALDYKAFFFLHLLSR